MGGMSQKPEKERGKIKDRAFWESRELYCTEIYINKGEAV